MQCLCGCGGTPIRGRFLPGHDQKLRRNLEKTAGGLESLKVIVESLDGYANGNLSEDLVRRMLEDLEELESIRAFDEAKASGDEAVPFEQAIEEIERARQ